MARAPGRYLTVVICCLLAALGAVVPGCGSYGEVSPLAYKYAEALYAICNRRDSQRLALLRDKVQASLDKQEITDQESVWLGDLIGLAESGQWKSAAQEARQMMEDQVKRP